MDDLTERLIILERELACLREEVAQIKARLIGIFPGVEELLFRRGITFTREEKKHNVLLPLGQDKIDIFYRLMKKYSFRIFMRDIIGRPKGFSVRQQWKYCSPATVKRYLSALSAIGLIQMNDQGIFQLVKENISSFGETLEWFVTEVLKREFRLSAVQGLKPRGLSAGGDLDILASAGEALIYLEVKSSPPKHIDPKEINAFARRVEELKPHAAVLLVDTQLRMKDKVVPMLIEALNPSQQSKPEKLKKGVYLFHGQVYISSSKPSLVHNLRYCFQEMYRREILD